MKYKKNVYKSFALITQFGITMIIPIFLCTFLGVFIDRRFGTSFFVIILFFLGAAAGFRNVYILAKSVFNTEKDPKYGGKSKEHK